MIKQWTRKDVLDDQRKHDAKAKAEKKKDAPDTRPPKEEDEK
jgi:hypothetical protein